MRQQGSIDDRQRLMRLRYDLWMARKALESCRDEVELGLDGYQHSAEHNIYVKEVLDRLSPPEESHGTG